MGFGCKDVNAQYCSQNRELSCPPPLYQVCIYACACVCVQAACACLFMHLCTYVSMHVHVCACRYLHGVCIHMHAHACITCACTCVHGCTSIYVCMFVMHLCLHWLAPEESGSPQVRPQAPPPEATSLYLPTIPSGLLPQLPSCLSGWS